jgi:hypothetical protein
MLSSTDLFLQCAPFTLFFGKFDEECRADGYLSTDERGQRRFVQNVVQNPLAAAMPVRASYTRILGKRFIAAIEEGPQEMMDELMEWWTLQCSTSLPTNEVSFKHFAVAPEKYVSVAIFPQFSNVGLSLWPSAFVTVDILAMELQGRAVLLPKAQKELRVVELGAGSGLTGAAMERILSPQRKSERYLKQLILTDYQQVVLDNCKANVERNAEGRDLLSIRVELLDWTEDNDNLFASWNCNVLLAADCIYDVDVLDGLAKTIKSFLRTGRDAVALVIQTHRQRNTLKIFFDAVAEVCKLETFQIGISNCGRFSLRGCPSWDCCDGSDELAMPSATSGVIGEFMPAFVEMASLICVHRLTWINK